MYFIVDSLYVLTAHAVGVKIKIHEIHQNFTKSSVYIN